MSKRDLTCKVLSSWHLKVEVKWAIIIQCFFMIFFFLSNNIFCTIIVPPFEADILLCGEISRVELQLFLRGKNITCFVPNV